MAMHRDDAELLLAWWTRRDEAAFRGLCDRHAGLVASICRRLGSPDPDEAAQAVFLVLARRAGSVAGACLASWLIGTARRVTAHQRRAAASRRHHEEEAAVEHARHRNAAPAEPAWAEAREHLDGALASLSTGRREAVLRFYLEGRSQAEVAAELGCSEGAVKTRVHEGLERLRAFFARKGVTLGAAALASGLAGESAAAEPALAASCAQAAFQPASAASAAALATGVTTAMFIKSVALASAAVLVAGSVVTATLGVGAETLANPPPVPVAALADPEPALIEAVAARAVEAGLIPDTRGATPWVGSLTIRDGTQVTTTGDSKTQHLLLKDGSWVVGLDQVDPRHVQPSDTVVVDASTAKAVPMSTFLQLGQDGVWGSIGIFDGNMFVSRLQSKEWARRFARLAPVDAASVTRATHLRVRLDIVNLLCLARAGHPNIGDVLRYDAAIEVDASYARVMAADSPLDLWLSSPDTTEPTGPLHLPSPSQWLDSQLRCLAVHRLLRADRGTQQAAKEAALVVVRGNPLEEANIRRLSAAVTLTLRPDMTAPIRDRIACWRPRVIKYPGTLRLSEIGQDQYYWRLPEPICRQKAVLDNRIEEVQDQGNLAAAEPLERERQELLRHHERPAAHDLIRAEDLDALIPLLGDTGPSRWVDQGVARTLGDNALRAIAHLLKADPRVLAGRKIDAPWTSPEQDACITAIATWWAVNRNRGLDDLVEENLGAMPIGQALVLVPGLPPRVNWAKPTPVLSFEHPPLEEQRRLGRMLCRRWRERPLTKADFEQHYESLCKFAMLMRTEPEAQKTFDALKPAGNNMIVFAALWQALHGQYAALNPMIDRLLAANDAASLSLGLAGCQPTASQLARALSFVEDPDHPGFTAAVAAIAGTQYKNTDQAAGAMLLAESQGQVALRLVLGLRLLRDQRTLPSGVSVGRVSSALWCIRMGNDADVNVPQRGPVLPLRIRRTEAAKDLRWCDLAASMLQGFEVLGLPKADFDLRATLPQRDAAIAALRPLVEARTTEALKAVGLRLPAEPARIDGVVGF